MSIKLQLQSDPVIGNPLVHQICVANILSLKSYQIFTFKPLQSKSFRLSYILDFMLIVRIVINLQV